MSLHYHYRRSKSDKGLAETKLPHEMFQSGDQVEAPHTGPERTHCSCEPPLLPGNIQGCPRMVARRYVPIAILTGAYVGPGSGLCYHYRQCSAVFQRLRQTRIRRPIPIRQPIPTNTKIGGGVWLWPSARLIVGFY